MTTRSALDQVVINNQGLSGEREAPGVGREKEVRPCTQRIMGLDNL